MYSLQLNRFRFVGSPRALAVRASRRAISSVLASRSRDGAPWPVHSTASTSGLNVPNCTVGPPGCQTHFDLIHAKAKHPERHSQAESRPVCHCSSRRERPPLMDCGGINPQKAAADTLYGGKTVIRSGEFTLALTLRTSHKTVLSTGLWGDRSLPNWTSPFAFGE